MQIFIGGSEITEAEPRAEPLTTNNPGIKRRHSCKYKKKRRSAIGRIEDLTNLVQLPHLKIRPKQDSTSCMVSNDHYRPSYDLRRTAVSPRMQCSPLALEYCSCSTYPVQRRSPKRSSFPRLKSHDHDP